MELSFLQLILLSLASFRLTRLLVYDKITEFLRNPFFDEIQQETENGELETYYIPKQTGIKRFFGELLSCYWCTGIWTTSVIVFLHYFFSQITIPIISILAIAGLASIIETIVQFFLDK
ncbi:MULTISPECIES: DUF1360 domain-containing protein [Bacillaceae]|uniref:DUF1360 domain-containing protein n=1 Tax=Bacillaceae TaxID=186817 RepID=UPI002FFE9C81